MSVTPRLEDDELTASVDWIRYGQWGESNERIQITDQRQTAVRRREAQCHKPRPGLGVGGIGASTVDAAGEVYKLRNLPQFAGSYAQASYGFVVGSTSSGDLWMQNEAGAIMHLKAKRTGLMLSLGGDAVVISLQ